MTVVPRLLGQHYWLVNLSILLVYLSFAHGFAEFCRLVASGDFLPSSAQKKKAAIAVSLKLLRPTTPLSQLHHHNPNPRRQEKSTKRVARFSSSSSTGIIVADDEENITMMQSTSSTGNSTSNARLRAQEWSQMDPNPVTAAAIASMLMNTNNNSNNNEKEEASTTLLLEQLFPPHNRRLPFGTAGLRGPMGPGPMRTNDLLIIQTAQGLAQYAVQQTSPANNNTSVVIGYDHRASAVYNISSRQLAVWTALVFRHCPGIRNVLLLDGHVATPLVPFAQQQLSQQQKQQQRDLTAVWGIMVTASHNPKQDAGYKIYSPDGCQMRSPMDEEIAALVQQNLVPWTNYAQPLQQTQQQQWAANNNSHPKNDDPCWGLSDPKATSALVDQYFAALKASHLMTAPTATASSSLGPAANQHPTTVGGGLRIAYSAMNGVGYPFVQRAFAAFGLPELYSVNTQQHADADFSATPFPNPEEREALDTVLQYATTNNCRVVLANDPDADRLAVAEQQAQEEPQQPQRATGADESLLWKAFTGDEIGAMLASVLYERSRTAVDADSVVPVLCASSVSSKFVQAFAAAKGCHFVETPPGFKWIGSTAQQLHGTPVPGNDNGTKKTYQSIFSYEESIGYCCGNVVFDKDGISAAVIVAQLAHDLYAQNSTLTEYLQHLYSTYGEFVSRNGYFQVADMDKIPAVLQKISEVGKTTSAKVPYGITKVCAVRKRPGPPTQVIITFENGCVGHFRASGTEPKFKYYFEMAGKPGVSRQAVAADLDIMTETVLDYLCEPKENGFVVPG
jgi:phosphomannomutase